MEDLFCQIMEAPEIILCILEKYRILELVFPVLIIRLWGENRLSIKIQENKRLKMSEILIMN